MDAQLKSIVARLENVASRFEAACAQGGGGSAAPSMSSSASDSPILKAYDEITNGSLAQFLSLSSKIGDDVAQMGNLVSKAFETQREFIVLVSKYGKPSDADLMKLLKPTSQAVQDVQNFREKNRPSKQFNHLSAISECITALGWIAVAPTPAPYIKEMLDAGQFYTNRILKDFKGVDQTHVDWVHSWMQTLTTLHGYVRQYHTTGVVWNAKNPPATASSAGPSAGSSAPPPPPPPGPPPPMDFGAPSEPDDGRAELFASITKGGDITKGLKKVRPEDQTHKNPSLRQQSTVPDKAAPAPPAKPAAKPISRPPVLELQGKKWIVENHQNNQQLVIETTGMNQSVYIYNCVKCAVQVKGKINSIVMDNCKKSSLLFENIVACVEFINCQSVQAQVTGIVPTVSIDKTDGFQLYLNANSMHTEIIASKCSEMNVSYPKANGDFSEVPLPEQFKTSWNGKKFVTVATEQA